MENIYDILFRNVLYIQSMYNYVKPMYGKRQEITPNNGVGGEGSRIFFKFSRALISLFYGIKLYNMCVCYLYRDTLKKKKAKRKKPHTFAVFVEVSVAEGQLSKSPERVSMGSWAPAGF